MNREELKTKILTAITRAKESGFKIVSLNWGYEHEGERGCCPITALALSVEPVEFRDLTRAKGQDGQSSVVFDKVHQVLKEEFNLSYSFINGFLSGFEHNTKCWDFCPDDYKLGHSIGAEVRKDIKQSEATMTTEQDDLAAAHVIADILNNALCAGFIVLIKSKAYTNMRMFHEVL